MGTKLTVDESQPRQTGGSYIARSMHGWPGVILFVWLLIEASMVTAIRTDFWIPSIPIATMWMSVATILAGTALFTSNVFYFGAASKKKKGAKNVSDPQPGISPLGKWDRIGRAANDQWITTTVTGARLFVFAFMIPFYNNNGNAPFQLLGATPTGDEIEQRGIVRFFEMSILATTGMALVIVLSTWADTLKRHADRTLSSDTEVEFETIASSSTTASHVSF
jgi:hypothetical protein